MVCSPIVHAYICQGDHPRHRRAPSMVGQAMQMTRSPDRAPEPFYALFPSDCLIKRISRGLVLDGTSPDTGAASPAPAPAQSRSACASRVRVVRHRRPIFRSVCSGDDMRIGACAGDSVRYRHAFFQAVIEGRQRPSIACRLRGFRLCGVARGCADCRLPPTLDCCSATHDSQKQSVHKS